MKKVIFGSAMFLGGLVSGATLLGGAMSQSWMVNDRFSALWNLERYGLMPALYGFAGVAAVGFAVAVWGLWEKK